MYNPGREVVCLIFCSRDCLRGYPRDCPRAAPRDCSREIHPRGWEVVKILAAGICTNDLHRLSFRYCYESVMIRSNLVCIFIVILGVFVVLNFFVYCYVPL